MKDIVFISPIMPDFNGNGLSMRAAQNLRALAGTFRVHLLIVEIYGAGLQMPAPDLGTYCTSWKIIPVPAKKTRSRLSAIRRLFSSLPVLPSWQKFDPGVAGEITLHLQSKQAAAVWLFRFYLLPWIGPWIENGGETWLDLDELESSSHLRLSHLYETKNSPEEAATAKQQSEAYRKLEKTGLGCFSRILVSSFREQENLQHLFNLKSEVWPNAVDLPNPSLSATGILNDQPRFFFVGNLYHPPNRDALHFLCSEILPRFRSLSGLSPRIEIAGRGSSRFKSNFGQEGLDWLGEPEDLTEPYRRADIVLVPLRSGGGTRIKILEAFAWNKPVVSTSIGAEGLGARHDQEILLADDADAFARALIDLIQNPRKARQLADAGRVFVEKYHHPSVLSLLAASLKQARP